MSDEMVNNIEKHYKFECPVCMEAFVDPRVLSCLHTYCKRCVEKLMKQEGEKHTIKCPSCQKDNEVPEGRVENLQINFFLNNLMSEVALHKDTQTADLVIACDNCTSDDPALERCDTCCQFLCSFCSQAHLRGKATCGHKLITLQELKSSGPAALAKPTMCKVHAGEILQLFCESCEVTICRDCAMVEHREHKYQFARDVYTKEKEAVNQLLEVTKAKQTILQDAVKDVVEMTTRVQEAGAKAAQQINSSVDRSVHALETGRNKLLQQAGGIEREKLKGLQNQQEELELALSSVTSGVEFTEKALRDGSEVEMLSMKKQMTERLRELNTVTQPLKPCTDDVISYDSKPSKPDDILNRLGWVSDSRTELEKCAVQTDNKMEVFKLRKEIKLSILVNDQRGRPRSKSSADDVSVEVKSLNTGNANQKVEVTDNGNGIHKASYIPRVSGIHRVFIRINGDDIRGSPFEWNVKGDVNPQMTTLLMEAGEVGVVYNSLIKQKRAFTVLTRDSNGEQISEEGLLISVEAKEINNQNPKAVRVQDYRNGRYTFKYKPNCTGNYQLTVKVNGDEIQGSPFTWGVEQWHLVARDRGNNNLNFSQDSMTVLTSWRGGGVVVGSCGFMAGHHSWKVKVGIGGVCAVGVTDSAVLPAKKENRWYWCEGSKYHISNGKSIYEEPSNISRFNEGDVIIVYLNHHNETLTVYHISSGHADTWDDVTVENNNLYPYFFSYENSKLTLVL